MDWAVAHFLRVNDRDELQPVRYVLGAPDEADAEDVRAALDGLGLFPAEGGIPWANHRLLSEREWPPYFDRRQAPCIMYEALLGPGETLHRLTVRISQQLAARIRLAAEREGVSVNRFVVDALRRAVERAGGQSWST
jgi:hypothetical protein